MEKKFYIYPGFPNVKFEMFYDDLFTHKWYRFTGEYVAALKKHFKRKHRYLSIAGDAPDL